MKKNKEEPIPYNYWNDLPESKYKNEWKISSSEDLKELKEYINFYGINYKTGEHVTLSLEEVSNISSSILLFTSEEERNEYIKKYNHEE